MFSLTLVLIIFAMIFNPLSARQLGYNIITPVDVIGPIYGEDRLQNSRLTSLIFDSPMVSDRDFTLSPLIFEEGFSEGVLQVDGTFYYEFRIRDGVKWHDNRDLTSEDIVFTYEAIKDPRTESSNAKNKIMGIHSVRYIDRRNVGVYFNTPYTGNLGFLTFNILPKFHFPNSPPLDKSDRFFTRSPVGTGRYRVKFGEYQSSRIELEKNESYFYPDLLPDDIDEVVVFQRDDIAMALESFRADRHVNFCPDVPPSERSFLEALAHIEVINYLEFSWQFIAFNLRKPLLKDEVLRKAINMAVDRVDYSGDIYQFQAELISGPFPMNFDGYNTLVDIPEFNLQRANELLTSNGYISPTPGGFREKDGNKLSFRFLYRRGEGGDIETLVNKFIQSMRLIGVEIIPERLEHHVFDVKILEERDFDMVLFEFFVGTDPDITPIFHSDFDRRRGFNITGLRDSQVDSLLEEVKTKTTVSDRNDIYRALHRIIADKNVGVFLWQTPKFIAFDNTVFPDLSSEKIDPIDMFRFIHRW